MLNLLSRLSVRLRLLLILGLLIVLLLVALFSYVTSSRAAEEDAREINRIGLIRELSTRVELTSREIATTNINDQNIALAFESEVNGLNVLSNAAQGIFLTGDNISRREFSTFFLQLTEAYPEIRSVQYIRVISSAARSAYENTLIVEGFADFQVYELSASGEKIAALDRPLYYPITYIISQGNGDDTLGFDVASDPVQRVALEEARDTAETIVTAPIVVMEGGTERSVVLLYAPIYRAGVTPISVGERQETNTGFLAIEVDTEALVARVLERIFEGGAILRIDDVSAGKPVYVNTQVVPAMSFLEIPVDVFGREWIVRVPQSIDVDAALRELETTSDDLDARISVLLEGSPELELAGLQRHTDANIFLAYDDLVAANTALQENINRFLTQDDELERVNLLPVIQRNTQDAIAQTDALINLLEDELEVTVDEGTRLSIVIAAIAAFIMLFGLVTVYQIGQNLRQLDRTALALAEGHLSSRAPVQGGGELSQIGYSLNVMADRLEGFIDTLEVRVAERTRDLQAVADVNAQISSVLQVDRLLQDVVDLTKERFGLYHSHIYLLDDTGVNLNLTAGAGHVGRQMVAEKRAIRLNNPGSVVAEAGRTQESVVIGNVDETMLFLPHPLLPDTKSELAVPLISRGQLLGVLDVQSNWVGHFTPEVTGVFELLGSQIAAALVNASVYQEAERSSRHEQALGTITQRLQGATNVDEALQVAVRELGKALRVPHTAIEIQLPDSNTDNGS